MKKNRFLIPFGLILIALLILLASFFLQNNRQILNLKAETPTGGSTCPANVASGTESCNNPGEWCITCLTNICPGDSNYNVESPYRCDNGTWKLQNPYGECSNKCPVSGVGEQSSQTSANGEGTNGGGTSDSNNSENNFSKQVNPPQDRNQCKNIMNSTDCELYKNPSHIPGGDVCRWEIWRSDGTLCNRCLEKNASASVLDSVCPPQAKEGFNCTQLRNIGACQTAIDHGYSCIYYPECNACDNQENSTMETACFGGSRTHKKKAINIALSVNLMHCPDNYIIQGIGYNVYDEYRQMTVSEHNQPYGIPGLSYGKVTFPVNLDLYYSYVSYTFSGNTIISDGVQNFYSNTPIKQSVSMRDLQKLTDISMQIAYDCSRPQ